MPGWSLSTIYRGMAEFMAIQIVCLLLVLIWPEIALWLPRQLK
jgi:TRAP-type mannitol/chloroaromatic compound transport system permease large subunit